MGKFMVCIGNFFLKNVLSIFSFVFILFVIADDDKLNPWMLAMIGIGGVFIAFVGVSIYLMWYVLLKLQYTCSKFYSVS